MAKTQRRFTYQPRDASTVKARSNQRGGDYDSIWKDGVKLFKPREGKNTIRILPPTWANADHYGYNVFVNYSIGVDNGQYLSLKSMKNERDPLDEARKQAEKDGNKKLADSLRPSKRVAFYLIDRNDEEAGPQIWVCPWTVDKSFCGIAIDEETGAVTQVDNPEGGEGGGCDIRFYVEGTGLGRNYPAEKMRVFKPSPLSENESEMNEWLDHAVAHPIPNMLNFYDYDHIASVFEGHVVKDDGDDETTKRPSKTSSKSQKPPFDEEEDNKTSSKARPKGVAEDEEVDDETGEVTTKPRSNGKPAVVVSKSGDENDDEDDTPPPETKMTAAAIRDRLRSRRPSTSED